jgi:hypothetical protein
MSNLNLCPTSTASWQQLVLEAQTASHIDLNEDLQSYLVFLLIRHLYNDPLLHRPIALDFLDNMHLRGASQQHHLQELGDKCLIISGFFPGLAERRLVPVQYFMGMGQGAYSALAFLSGKANAQLYHALSGGFLPLVELLRTIKQLPLDEHQSSDRARLFKILSRQ